MPPSDLALHGLLASTLLDQPAGGWWPGHAVTPATLSMPVVGVIVVPLDSRFMGNLAGASGWCCGYGRSRGHSCPRSHGQVGVAAIELSLMIFLAEGQLDWAVAVTLAVGVSWASCCFPFQCPCSMPVGA